MASDYHADIDLCQGFRPWNLGKDFCFAWQCWMPYFSDPACGDSLLTERISDSSNTVSWWGRTLERY